MNFSEFQISETKRTQIRRTNYPLSAANGDLRLALYMNHTQSIYKHIIKSNGNNGELGKNVLDSFDQLKNIKYGAIVR